MTDYYVYGDCLEDEQVNASEVSSLRIKCFPNLHIHLGHLADTFFQSNLQSVHLSQERKHDISPSME